MAQEQSPLKVMSFRQLRKVASEHNVLRYSRMRKAQLVSAIKQLVQERTIQQLQIKQIATNQTLVQKKQEMEVAKSETGRDKIVRELLSSVDDELGDLPDSYGRSSIVMLPRDPQWSYAYWDIPNDAKEELRRQGGQQLALRLCDITDINLNYQSPHSVQEYLCDELAREWYLPIPVSGRDYIIDIGYRCFDGRWLVLARSTSVHIPPVYPSDWVEDIFVTINSDQELQNNIVYNLASTTRHQAVTEDISAYNEFFDMKPEIKEHNSAVGSVSNSIQHIAGSVISPHVHKEVVSSYVFPSGVGVWAFPSASGVNISTMSAAESRVSVSAPPEYLRKFWLVADAELIVHGATEPDATVTINGRPIELNSDGTFRFQVSFQDGLIDCPIVAIAADGEQTCYIQMKFNRNTSEDFT